MEMPRPDGRCRSSPSAGLCFICSLVKILPTPPAFQRAPDQRALKNNATAEAELERQIPEELGLNAVAGELSARAPHAPLSSTKA